MEQIAEKDFYVSVLDSVLQQLAVIDDRGRILWVNKAWTAFAAENGADPALVCPGSDYLRACRNAGEGGDETAGAILRGIQSVMSGRRRMFSCEYPCHSPREKRWFLMRVTPVGTGARRFVITHENITERKIVEEAANESAAMDALTGIANRRQFDMVLGAEWCRARRQGHPLSMAMLDIDFFKHYNDHYGHLAGDACLRRVGRALGAFCRRPGDLVARYGGEEFAMILANTDAAAARRLTEEVRAAIMALAIPHEYSAAAGCVTVSAGIASIEPARHAGLSPDALIDAADHALYDAKSQGRNRVTIGPAPVPQAAPARSAL